MANVKLLPGGSNIIHAPLIEKDGSMSRIWQQWWAAAIPRIQDALNKFETFEGTIGLAAIVQGRPGTVADALTHVDPVGVVLSPGLVPASDLAAGAVQLPTGALTNTLGSAALLNSTDFDPAGAAAAAQATAIATSETFATTADGAVLTAAQAFAANASNISSGTLATARLGGISGTVHLGPYTVGGTQGSLTLTNGLVTAFVDPT